jgi:protein tyrosine/serine phosphatase
MHQPNQARRRRNWAFLCACITLLATSMLPPGTSVGAAAGPPIRIDNFGQINQNYYRGAQPNAAEFMELQRLGIKTVIDLQEDGNSKEPAWVRNAGMQYFNIPLSSTRPATDGQTEHFLKLVNDPQNWPVFVHCAGGRHRTGEMTAIYRITRDSWTADQAYQEMEQYDYYSIGGHGPLKDYVFEYYSKYLAARIAAATADPGK